MIFRKKHTKNYTVIGNHTIEDKNLTWGAMGILIFLLSKPDDWKPTKSHLENYNKSGKYTTNTSFKLLIELGYIEDKGKEHINGKFTGHKIYYVYDMPKSGIQSSDKPEPVKPLKHKDLPKSGFQSSANLSLPSTDHYQGTFS